MAERPSAHHKRSSLDITNDQGQRVGLTFGLTFRRSLMASRRARKLQTRADRTGYSAISRGLLEVPATERCHARTRAGDCLFREHARVNPRRASAGGVRVLIKTEKFSAWAWRSSGLIGQRGVASAIRAWDGRGPGDDRLAAIKIDVVLKFGDRPAGRAVMQFLDGEHGDAPDIADQDYGARAARRKGRVCFPHASPGQNGLAHY